MPKLINRNPKLAKLKKYAVVYYHGKIHYLGHHGSPEALTAYNRFCAEIQSNPTFYLTKGETDIAISELAAAFLDHTKTRADPATYSYWRIIILDFLLKLYGDDTPVNSFKPSSLKLVRDEMIQFCSFCPAGSVVELLTGYTHRIVSMFGWGVENVFVTKFHCNCDRGGT
jgi:hypothetical protein